MSPRTNKTLLARVSSDRLAGRADQIERLYLHAVSAAQPHCLRVSGAPDAGSSEMLRHVFDRLFYSQRFVVPFYFAVRAGDRTAGAAAARFTYEFLLQAVAFRRNDPALIAATPSVAELVHLAPLADAAWAERISKTLTESGLAAGSGEFIRPLIASPLSAASSGKLRICLIIDDLHEASKLDDGRKLLDEIITIADTSKLPVILAARRRFSIELDSRQTLHVDPLTRADAVSLADTLAEDANVELNDQTRDLIAVQFGQNPAMIRSLIDAAAEKKLGFNSYREVEQIYAAELLNGRIDEHFDNIFANAAQEAEVTHELIEMLSIAAERPSERFALSALRDRLKLPREAFGRLTESLVVNEIIEANDSAARLADNDILFDFLDSRRMMRDGKSSAAIAASTIMRSLSRAPRLMSRAYRREAALGLEGITMQFDAQAVPSVLIDYREFRERYKGLSDLETREQLADETAMLELPQISYAGPIADRVEEFGGIIEPERAIAAVGFATRNYRDEDQTAWLVAEIDSKLEADNAAAREWCDRLDAAAAECSFENYRIWLIAPEGFSEAALDLLAERNAFGSSRRQAILLRDRLQGNVGNTDKRSTEYEIVIPAGDDSELIAAHALEEIARRYDFPAKAVNQIKTALVEASINATEHSLSPDGKIYQKFVIDKDKIVLTISNRGLRLATKAADERQAGSGTSQDQRRGWGINLIRSLMDDIRIESVDDGTRIVMTKYAAA